MYHLYKFNLLQTVRRYGDLFWTLFFPIILGTLFYVSFWNNEEGQMTTLPVAVVGEENPFFGTFLEQLDGTTLAVSEMDEAEAEAALEDGTVSGIYYNTKTPMLTVSGVGMSESVLEMLLTTYLQNETMMRDIAAEHPLGIAGAISSVSDYQEFVEPVSAGGRTVQSEIVYFFALIGMTCLFGSFTGMSSSVGLCADQSSLAARRSIVPVGRLSMVCSELLACFTVQFGCVCVLLCYLHFALGISFGPNWPLLLPVCALGSTAGISLGIFIGTLHIPEGPKNGILVAGSLVMSFLAGLMFGDMKDIVEHTVPIVNRLNPAALISDAFYAVAVYENRERYFMNLVLLAAITGLLTLCSFLKLRRERYDSL